MTKKRALKRKPRVVLKVGKRLLVAKIEAEIPEPFSTDEIEDPVLEATPLTPWEEPESAPFERSGHGEQKRGFWARLWAKFTGEDKWT